MIYEKEDPRIREQEWGNFQVPKELPKVMGERRKIGAFFYRFPTGERYGLIVVWFSNQSHFQGGH